MGIRIGFLTTLGVNVGDEFIREGIRHVLDQCGVPYAPFYVNKHDATTLSRPVEDEVCEAQNKFWETDLFIQAGAPVYWRLGPHTSLTSEWHRWFWEELVFCQKPPGPPPLFVNLGAGATQPWGVGPVAFLEDKDCVDFARKAGERSLLTTVRDPCAMRVLTTLGVSHHVLPCPAFLAAGRHPASGPVKDLIGVNLMPLASHDDLSGDFDRARWRDAAAAMVDRLRPENAVLFICHNQEELTFARQFSHPGERVFWSSEWRDYFDAYAHCEIVVANRVHGAVCAAGFGVPAIIIGNDTRAEIGDLIGLPRFHAVELAVEAVVDTVQDLRQRRTEETARLLRLRDETVRQYRELLEPIIRRVAFGRDDPSSFPTTRRGAARLEVLEEQGRRTTELEGEVHRWLEEAKKYSAQAQQLETARTEVLKQLESSEVARTELSQQLSRLTEENRHHQSQLTEAGATINGLRTDLERRRVENESLAEEKRDLLGQFDKTRGNLAATEADRTRMATDIAKLVANLARLEAELARVRTANESLTGELQASRDESRNLTSRLDAQSRALDGAVKSLEAARTRIKELNRLLTEIDERWATRLLKASRLWPR